MARFSEYLGSIKSGLSSLGPTTELCLTCGNDSCDLDSIVSALVYAHYVATVKSEKGSLSLPLLQCKKEDLVLRREAQLLCDMLGIDSSALCYLGDISPGALSAVGKLSLVLVDHNTPTGILKSFSSSIVQVLDHHQEADNSVANKPGVSTTLEMVGSCSSLVAREILKDHAYTVDLTVATLLLSAILLDTGNLKAAGRVTKTDELAVEELTKLLPSSFNRDDHFHKLFEARFDTSNLSVTHLLEHDYKECAVNGYTIGFSTVTAPLTELLSSESVNSDFTAFHSGHKLDALLVLGVSMSRANKIQRQIAVFEPEGTNTEFSESIVSMLEADKDLNCERIDDVSDFRGVVMQQGNPDLSRKHVLPIVTAFIKSVESEYPQTGLSPSHVVLEHSSSAAVLGVASEQPYPLEPSITILPSPAEEAPPVVPSETAPIPEYTSAQEHEERRAHRSIIIGAEEISVSMDMVEPYKKIVQHTGYIGESRQALVVISACFLPPRSLPNYRHVVHHVFYYVLSVLDKLIVDDYTIVYLHSGAPRNSIPSLPMLHRFYKSIDRKLRKHLTRLFIVHPTFWVKSVLRLSRPFISKKFWRKVSFIPTLHDLSGHVHIDGDYLSAPVITMDQLIMSRRPTGQRYELRQKSPTATQDKQHSDKDSSNDVPVQDQENISEE